MLLPYKLTAGLTEVYSAVNVKLLSLPVAFNVTVALSVVHINWLSAYAVIPF